MGEYADAMRRMSAREWTFSTQDQPKPPMTITTKIERIQPTVAGLNERGDFVWEGRAMERWQMEMFKVAQIAGAKIARWMEVFYYQEKDREFRASDSMIPDEDRAMTKEGIEDRLRMYPAPKRTRRYANGD